MGGAVAGSSSALVVARNEAQRDMYNFEYNIIVARNVAQRGMYNFEYKM